MYDSLLNVKERDMVQTLYDFLLHLLNYCHVPCHTETKLCFSPVLFNKIKFIVIFWIEVA
jgi:hypothetical protein